MKKFNLIWIIGLFLIALPLAFADNIDQYIWDNTIFAYNPYNLTHDNSSSPNTEGVITGTPTLSSSCVFNSSKCYQDTGGASGNFVRFTPDGNMKYLNNMS